MMWYLSCWSFPSIRRATNYKLCCFRCILSHELKGSPFGSWRFKSNLSYVSYHQCRRCWNLYCACWIMNRTIGLDVVYLIIVETYTHSLCFLLTVFIVMSLFFSLETYQSLANYFAVLPIPATLWNSLSSAPWIAELGFLVAGWDRVDIYLFSFC